MIREILTETTARLHIPYFWAVYLHQGRTDPIRPVRARVLVWFANPLRDDPRLDGGYPRTQGQQVRLTASQYREGLAANREARRNGAPPVMIVRKIVTKSVDPKPFFSTDPGGGMSAFPAVAEKIIAEWIREQLQKMLREKLPSIKLQF